MSISQRRHIRFSLDLPAMLIAKGGRRQETTLHQVSIGGCLAAWHEHFYTGDELRLEVELPNKNRLPLKSKVIYRFNKTGVGIRFTDISQFEQRLLSGVIAHRMDTLGMPMAVSPFDQPETFGSPSEREEKLDDVMSSES